MLLFFGLRFVSAIRFASDNFSAISLIFLGGGGQMSHSHSSKKTIHFLELHIDWIKWMRRCCNQTVERDQDILLKQETSRMSLATASTCMQVSYSQGVTTLIAKIWVKWEILPFGADFFPNLGFCFWILLFFLFRHLPALQALGPWELSTQQAILVNGFPSTCRWY